MPTARCSELGYWLSRSDLLLIVPSINSTQHCLAGLGQDPEAWLAEFRANDAVTTGRRYLRILPQILGFSLSVVYGCGDCHRIGSYNDL
jgi:hypothetical protein